MLVSNKNGTAVATPPASRLGFVYLFRTNFTDVYKLGFTEKSLSARHKKLMERLGVARIEAAVMTIDAREQEASLFEVAWQHADRIKTNLVRKRLKATELFVMDEVGIIAVRGHLSGHMAIHPYVHRPDSTPQRATAVSKAIEFNRSAAEVEMTLKGMDKVLRKLAQTAAPF